MTYELDISIFADNEDHATTFYCICSKVKVTLIEISRQAQIDMGPAYLKKLIYSEVDKYALKN